MPKPASAPFAPAEEALMRPLLHGLLRAGWVNQMSLAADEVPWHEKRIDLVMRSTGGRVLAIELKVRDWGKAINQAYLNRWVADESWVAVWHSRFTPTAWDAARDSGVGVLVVTVDTAYELLRPASPLASVSSDGPIQATLVNRATRVRDLLGNRR